MKTVLFHRDYRGFSGGHLKVWDYFNHVRYAPGFVPRIVFAPRSVRGGDNPWAAESETVLPAWPKEPPDILFLGGMDWVAAEGSLKAWPDTPVINLIQHVRHASRWTPLFRFLKRKAIRVCVSAEVAEAILATKRVNGPVRVIPNGIDLSKLPAVEPDQRQRGTDLLIAALKKPALGRALARSLSGAAPRMEVLDRMLPREEYLRRVADARVTLFLPGRTEGFYLPALEGMALGTLVICPDCVGNRSFCRSGANCLMPDYAAGALSRAAREALGLDPREAERLREEGKRTAAAHNLEIERKLFLELLPRVEELLS